MVHSPVPNETNRLGCFYNVRWEISQKLADISLLLALQSIQHFPKDFCAPNMDWNMVKLCCSRSQI